MRATIVDLRYRMKDVLGALDRGETVIVLHRGKEKATLTPIAAAPTELAPKTADQPLFGLWRDRQDLVDTDAYVRKLRQPRTLPSKASVRKELKSDVRKKQK